MKENNIIFDTLGSDPEFFLEDDHGNYLPGHMITTGEKFNPEPLEKPGFSIFNDNLSLEGNIPPSRTYEEFYTNMIYLLDQIQQRADKLNLRIAHKGQVEFDKQHCDTIQGQEFACSSATYAWKSVYYKTFDAVTIDSIKTPSFPESTMRTAGFHIHIGYHVENPTFIDEMVYNVLIAKLFDLYITIPSLYIQQLETFREKNFGLLGNFRTKSYGLECRSLSAYFSHPRYYEWLWMQIKDLFEYINSLSPKQILDILELHMYQEPNKETVSKELQKVIPDTTELVNKFSQLINIYNYAI